MATDQAPAGSGAGINWLVSYPKSGNTWMRMLLANYFGETEQAQDINRAGILHGIAASREHFDRALGISSSDLSAAEVAGLRPHVHAHLAAQADRPIWIKVHDAQQAIGDDWLFPPRSSHAVVYLIRHPLDVAVSYAFHTGQSVAGTVDTMCRSDTVIAERSPHQLPQRLGSWSDHVASWVDQAGCPVCVIRYEDMLADPAGQLARAIACGRPGLRIDPLRIAHAVEQSRFDRLQAAEDAHGFRERSEKSPRFFRRGLANAWHEHLNADLERRMRAVHHAMMSRFGYE